MDTVKGTKHQIEAKKGSYEDKERQKAISIASTQAEDYKQKSLSCRIRMLVGYGKNDQMNATIITTKEEVNYQFWGPGRNKVIKEYKYMYQRTVILGMMS